MVETRRVKDSKEKTVGIALETRKGIAARVRDFLVGTENQAVATRGNSVQNHRLQDATHEDGENHLLKHVATRDLAALQSQNHTVLTKFPTPVVGVAVTAAGIITRAGGTLDFGILIITAATATANTMRETVTIRIVVVRHRVTVLVQITVAPTPSTCRQSFNISPVII